MLKCQRLYIEAAIAAKLPDAIDAAVVASAYDFSDVFSLVIDTKETMLNKGNVQSSDECVSLDFGNCKRTEFGHSLDASVPEYVTLIDHGGLLVPPSNSFFIQTCITHNGPVGFAYSFCNVYGNTIGVSYASTFEPLGANNNTAYIVFDKDKAYVIGSRDSHYIAKRACEFVVGAIVVLNAPYGIDKTEHTAHKGFARKLVKRGLPKPKPYTVITLAKHVRPDLIVQGHGSPKAFHFVRSHLRHLIARDGLPYATKVKAHWRGDPALGILKTDYKVKP